MSLSASEYSLPYGWKVVTSRRYPDRVYYFNLSTGASTWECPDLVLKASLDQQISPGNKDSSKLQVKEFKCREPSSSDETLNIDSSVKKVTSNAPSKSSKVKKRWRKSKKKHVKIGNDFLSSTEEVSKCVIPPTAVVTPVVFKESVNKSHVLTLPQTLPSRKPNIKPCVGKKQSTYVELNASVKKDIFVKRKETVLDSNKRHSSEQVRNCKRIKHALKDEVKSDVIKEQKKGENDQYTEIVPSVFENKDYVEDIEMLDVSEDLTKIDDLAPTKEALYASYYIVVDTNVLMRELTNIDEIKDTPIEGCGPPHIFIPWIVIQELDSLKRSAKVSSVGRAATEAVRYLNAVLKAKHPRFHGQSPQEAKDWAKDFRQCNDDRILECCMSLADKMPKEKVILLTNDRNLSNKALICDIIVHTWESMMKSLKADVNIKGSKQKNNILENGKRKSSLNGSSSSSNNTPSAKSSRYENSEPKSTTVTQDSGEKKLLSIHGECTQEIQNHMANARLMLKKVLYSFVVEEMTEAYGEPWKAFGIEIQYLKGLLDAIIKYWKMVFVFTLSEKDRRNFDVLHEKVNRAEGFFGKKEECLNILTAIEDVFRPIKRKWPQIEVPIEKIQDIRASCVELFSKHDNFKNTTEFQSALNAFEHNWTIMNYLCGMIMDFCQLPHNFPYEKPQMMPPTSQFHVLMCNLYPGVQQLKQIMRSMVEAIKQNTPLEIIFKKLHKALLDFAPSLEIKYEKPSLPDFTPETLKHFCLSPENRERIELGYQQLETFHSKLAEALKVMMSRKSQKSQETMVCD